MFPEVSLRCGLTFLQTLGRPIKSESDRKFECHELTHVKKDYCLNMQDLDKTCCLRVLLQESTVSLHLFGKLEVPFPFKIIVAHVFCSEDV